MPMREDQTLNHQPVRATEHRERGSVLIFVVTILVLMVLLGTSYLQMARVERLAMSKVGGGDIEAVSQACIDQIAQTLLDDIFDANGNFFNPSPVDEPGDESHDYPGTNNQAIPENKFTVTQMLNGVTIPTWGGHLDDMWLASTVPDFESDPNKPRWPHITNLNNIFLRIPHRKGSSPQPDERVIDNSSGSYFEWDTGLKITGDSQAMDYSDSTEEWLTWGVDADGDGVLDSRWTWAPIWQIGPVRYVMAVRVIDLSAMLNVNVATALTTDGQVTSPVINYAPRGYFPSDLDLTRLMHRAGMSSFSGWKSNLNQMLAYRGLGEPLPSSPLPLGLTGGLAFTDESRIAAWIENGRLYGMEMNDIGTNIYRRFGIGADIMSELELRYRNGLNSGDIDDETTLEENLKELLNTEIPMTSLEDLVGGQDGVDIAEYMQGAPDTVAVADRRFPTVRHMLTTVSGSVPYAPNHDDVHDGEHELKYDLVTAQNALSTQRIHRIAEQIQDTLTIGSEKYLHISDDTELDQIATEFALAINDYMDQDSKPSSSVTYGVTYYGLELMPFLREVYAQIGYEDQDLLMEDPMLPGPPISGNDDLFDTWVAEVDPVSGFSGSEAMAIEIGNPFDRPIRAGDLNGRIRIQVIQDETEVSAWTIQGVSGDLGPRDKLIIVSNPTDPIEEGGTTRDDLVADLNIPGNVDVVTAPAGTLRFRPDGSKITVTLAIDGTANSVVYDRLKFNRMRFPEQVQHWDDGQHPSAIDSHGQGSMARDGREIRYLSNDGKGLIDNRIRNPNTNGYLADKMDRLGEDDKGSPIDGDPALDQLQIPIANRRFFSTAELGWIFMFGFTDEPDGDFPSRLDGAKSLPESRRFLDFSTSAAVPNATGIPHAAMILDQFTTINSHTDNVDNDNEDGDGNVNTGDDEDREQMVAGRINLNTAPLHVLTLGAPLPSISNPSTEIDEAEELFRSIVEYRDFPELRSQFVDGLSANNLRVDPGIASIGELMFIRGRNPRTSADMQWYGENNFSEKGTAVDLYPMPEMIPGQSAEQHDAIDGAEERMARFQFLSNVFTTRSDVFCAYVKVRGYVAGDFRLGPVEAAHFFVLFDRSQILDRSDTVRILGVYTMR